MRNKTFVGLILLLASVAQALELKETLLSEENNISSYHYTLSGGEKKFSGDAMLVVSTNRDADRLVVIIPGYCPQGDPYLQRPSQFVGRWDLARIATTNRMNFLVIGMADSMYPRFKAGKGDVASDLAFLKAVIETNWQRTGGLAIWLVGVSTGVEGAVKLLAIPDAPVAVKGIIGLSGTWDYAKLPPKSGEYGLHLAIFGKDKKVWAAENPKDIIPQFDREGLSIHAFSEEKSAFFDQMLAVKDIKHLKTRIEIHPGFGYGLKHNWEFWSSKALRDAMFHIIRMNE